MLQEFLSLVQFLHLLYQKFIVIFQILVFDQKGLLYSIKILQTSISEHGAFNVIVLLKCVPMGFYLAHESLILA
jgi:hypothetical protein